jgi:PAS domain S-box-containing protein
MSVTSFPKNAFNLSLIPTSTLKKNPTLQQLAFENSLQPHLVTTVNGKVLAANKTACSLLGYTEKALLSKSRTTLLDMDRSGFEKLLNNNLKKNKSPVPVTVIRKNGKRVRCEASSVYINDAGNEPCIVISLLDMSRGILIQKKIDTRKEKIVADNINLAAAIQKIIDIRKEKLVVDNIIVALAKSDARLAANNEWKKHIGLTSYDVMWDWDIDSDQIYVSDSVSEVFGYTIKNNAVLYTDFWKCILPAEVNGIRKKLSKALSSGKKSWTASFMFRCENGSMSSATCRASIVRDGGGKAIRLIGALQDVSRLQQLEQQLKDHITVRDELSDIFQVASRLSFDGRWDWNLITNEFFLGEGFQEIFGHVSTKNKASVKMNWSNHLHPEDKLKVEKSLQTAITTDLAYWEENYRFIKADGSIAKVFNRASIIRNSSGKACRIVGVMQDRSKQKKLEDRLEQEITSKDKQIAEAAEDAKVSERSEIGRELHDNVNQLLGVSKLYIDMASREGSDSKELLSRSSKYMMTAIEEIRKLTKGLTTDIIQNLGLSEAIQTLADDTMEISDVQINCEFSGFIETEWNQKFKLNLFRIVQEQLNNILKHAKATSITIKLLKTTLSVTLTITDNGIGYNTEMKRKGIGVANIKSRAATYNGVASFVSEKNKGCTLRVSFPLPLPVNL